MIFPYQTSNNTSFDDALYQQTIFHDDLHNNATCQQPMSNDASFNNASYQQPMSYDITYNNVFYHQQQMFNDALFNDASHYQSIYCDFSFNNVAISPNNNHQQHDASNDDTSLRNYQQFIFSNNVSPVQNSHINPPLNITINSIQMNIIIMSVTNSDTQNQFQQNHTYLNNSSLLTINSQTRS
ncbi:hypothetical protein RclHR1_02030003 [Rhizophagus clarus]|nr:hypothetical protein RclHR1_02030003 [Rhizophagus clarus]